MDLDLEELAAVIELLDKADFTDFRYEKGDLRIAVRRGGPPLDQPTVSAPPETARTEIATAARPTPAVATSTVTVESAAADPVTDEGVVLIRATMLGAFYRSPKP